MDCPKCSRQIPDDARSCNSCGRELTAAKPGAETLYVKISKAAVASFICSLIALVCVLPGLIAMINAGVLNPSSEFENDNIFTRWDQDDKMRRAELELRIEPAEATDSLLVNDPAPSR